MKRSLLILLAGALVLADDFRWTYTAGYQVTGTSASASLQLAAGAARRARPITASFTCESAACDIQLTRNGSLATATAGTIVKNRTACPAAVATWWTASNSTGGTALPIEPQPFAGKTVLDLSQMELVPGETLKLTLTSVGSQKLTINVTFEEIP